jgi:hypothetical protein
MRVGILTTNHGPHPAAKWAEQSAAMIADVIQIEPTALGFAELNAQKAEFENEVSAALHSDHEAVQTDERDAIAAHGMARLSHSTDPDLEHLDAAVEKVVAVAKTKIFGSHFDKPEVKAFVRTTLGQHFATSKHIERSWHADRNPDSPEAQAFKAQKEQ